MTKNQRGACILPRIRGKEEIAETQAPIKIAIETRGGTVCGVYCSDSFAEVTLYDFDNFELPPKIMAAMEESLNEDIGLLHNVPYYRAESELLDEE